MRDRDTVILESLYGKVIQEKFYEYNIPSDKKTLMYDFYVVNYLEYLLNLPSRGFRDLPEDIADSVKNMASSLYPYLKKELLDAVFFAVSCEFRHFDSNSYRKTNLARMGEYDEKIQEFYRNYLKYYKYHMKGVSDQEELTKVFGVRKPSSKQRTPQEEKSNEMVRQLSFKAVNYALEKTGLSKRNFIQIAKDAFEVMDWNSSYGGDAWARICNGWLLLDSAEKMESQAPVSTQKIEGGKQPEYYSRRDKKKKSEDTGEMTIPTAIDHIYDLQHNTDTVFNKLKSYYREGSGYGWVKKALDDKANVKSYYELLPKASGTIRTVAPRLLFNKLGETWQSYLKKYKPSSRFDLTKSEPTLKQYLASEVTPSDLKYYINHAQMGITSSYVLPMGYSLTVFKNDKTYNDIEITVKKENKEVSVWKLNFPIPKDVEDLVIEDLRKKINKAMADDQKKSSGQKEYITGDEVYYVLKNVPKNQNYKLKSGYVAFVQKKYVESAGYSLDHVFVMKAGGDIVAANPIATKGLTILSQKIADKLNEMIEDGSYEQNEKTSEPKDGKSINYMVEDELKNLYKQTTWPDFKKAGTTEPYDLDDAYSVYIRKSKTTEGLFDMMIQKNNSIIASISDINLLSNKKVLELINARINEYEYESSGGIKNYEEKIREAMGNFFAMKSSSHTIQITPNVTFTIIDPKDGTIVIQLRKGNTLLDTYGFPLNYLDDDKNGVKSDKLVSNLNEWVNETLASIKTDEPEPKDQEDYSFQITEVLNKIFTDQNKKVKHEKVELPIEKNPLQLHVFSKPEDRYYHGSLTFILSAPNGPVTDINPKITLPQNMFLHHSYQDAVLKINKWINRIVSGEKSKEKSTDNFEKNLMKPNMVKKMLDELSESTLASGQLRESVLDRKYNVWIEKGISTDPKTPEWSGKSVFLVYIEDVEKHEMIMDSQDNIITYKMLVKKGKDYTQDAKMISDWVNGIIKNDYLSI